MKVSNVKAGCDMLLALHANCPMSSQGHAVQRMRRTEITQLAYECVSLSLSLSISLCVCVCAGRHSTQSPVNVLFSHKARPHSAEHITYVCVTACVSVYNNIIKYKYTRTLCGCMGVCVYKMSTCINRNVTSSRLCVRLLLLLVGELAIKTGGPARVHLK